MAEWLEVTVGVVLGGIISIATGWLADRRLAARDRERRKEEREERLATKRAEFQRETLLALQVTAQKLIRNAGASNFQDVVAYRTTGKWQKEPLPEELSDENLKLNTETLLLASRVRDHEVRQLADELRSQVSKVMLSSSECDAEDRMLIVANIQNALIQRIGNLVRQLDEAN